MKNIVTSALALGLILLAGAMAWLAYSIQGVTRELPAVMTRVDDINTRIDAIVETIPLITAELPPILEEVAKIRETVPPILAEVEHIRKAVPPILAEVEQIREAIPPILTRIDAIQEQVTEVEKNLPLIAKTVDTAAGAVNTVATQVEATLPRVDKALVEVEAIRGEIPGILSQVEGIVADSQQIVGRASEDAVTGVMKGVITSPFRLLKDAGNSITGSLFTTQRMTSEDEAHFEESTKRLLHNLELKSVTWSNPRSGNKGKVTLQRAFQDSGTSCVSLQFDLIPKSGKKESAIKNGCLMKDGTWQIK
ncbi:hypothetical protein DSLASN_43260 [Desulfoluna limicola]|uniref:Surface antigen domain-containing protein n=1 Tax=Desulfoluna limicola TaxID=2810562 RepID=A0ABM7PME9_9BACT|nr:hypothetical protein [Desulfoluna limicola]BCS98694.1 hypothetical protein DSLASN_43260 [Desulfoluna limicola]